MKKALYALLLITCCLFLTQCKIASRILYFNAPNSNDHKKFSTVTIEADPHNCNNDFIKTKNERLPNPILWTSGKPINKALSVEQYLQETNTHCLIILRNDSLIYENYFNGFHDKKERIVFSLAKVFITALTDIAIQEGHIKSVDQKVSDFLPGFDENGKENITIDHLLNMTSGLNQDDYNKFLTTAKTYYHTNLDQLIENETIRYDPGSTFIYKSLDTQVLGRCIEEATGQKIYDYLKSRIWDKIGLCNNAQVTLDQKDGTARMFGGTAMVPMDLVKFGHLFLNNGKYKEEQIISPEWITEIENKKSFDKWIGYRHGWWRDVIINKSVFEDKEYFAAGFNGQNLYIDPENKTIILRLGQNKGGNIWHISLGLLSKIINGKSIRHLVKEENLYGSYKAEDGEQVDIISRRKNKWQMDYGNNKTTLISYGPKSLANLSKKIRLTFDTNEAGILKGFYYDNTLEPLKYFEKMDIYSPQK